MKGSSVLYLWQRALCFRVHIIEMLELRVVPQIQEQDWWPLLHSNRIDGVRAFGNEIGTTA